MERESESNISWAEILDKTETNEKMSSEEEIKSFKELNRKGLFTSKSMRPKAYIQLNPKSKKDYVNALRGRKEETSELNINYKTLTKTFLR